MNDRTQILKNEALSQLQGGRLAEAKVSYRRLCESAPRDADSWSLLGAVHGMLGEFEQAEACCRRVIGLQPKAIGAYSNLGNALRFQGKLDEAEECYRQALELMPDYAEAHNNLGNLLREQGQPQEAETCYRQAIALAPNYADAHSNLGIAQRDQGQLTDAVANYRRALALDPNHRDAWYALGHALTEQGDLAVAAEVYEQLVRKHPQDARTWAALGGIYIQFKQFDKAIASCQQAIAYGPDCAEGYFRLGAVYQAMDQRDGAREMYQRALALEPKMASARYFLASLDNEAVSVECRNDHVRGIFDDYAERFDAHLVGDLGYRAPELLHRAVQRVLGDQGKELEVLDLGCGTGLCGVPFRDIAKRLTGVDLSPRMIRKARARGIYDELLLGDLLTPLQGQDARYDLIVAADVFIYVGNLAAVFAACQIALRPRGLFAFSTEHEPHTPSYVLRPSGRYAHSTEYIQALAHGTGFVEAGLEQADIRQEAGKPTDGRIFIFQQPPRTS